MKNQSKGQDTKEHIIKCSRELFYEYGYHATTARMISNHSNTNLGLLNYYFKGKIEIGATVYYDIRNTFDKLILQNEPDLSEIDLFLFSSAVELYLCLENSNYGRFFHEIIFEPTVHFRTLNYIIGVFTKHAIYEGSDDYPYLAGVSVSAVKPALVESSLSLDKKVTIDTYIDYYLQQQLHYFGIDTDLSVNYLNMLKKYYINIAGNFTPILARLL